jgi:hypothetical protein
MSEICVETNALVGISVYGWEMYSEDNNGWEKDFRDKDVVPIQIQLSINMGVPRIFYRGRATNHNFFKNLIFFHLFFLFYL